MWNFIQSNVGLFGVFISACVAIFLFLAGRALLGLDKWKTDSIAWFKRECDYNKSTTKEYKREIELIVESLKRSFKSEIEEMKLDFSKSIQELKDDNAKYRQFCIFRIDEDIKKIADKRELNGFKIADISAKHKYLEDVFGDIRQFYEENRSLLTSKAEIFESINTLKNMVQDLSGKLTSIEGRLEKIEMGNEMS